MPRDLALLFCFFFFFSPLLCYHVLPKPTQMTTGITKVPIAPSSFTVTTTLPTTPTPFFDATVLRYKNLIFAFPNSTASPYTFSLSLDIVSFTQDLQFGIPENYSLSLYVSGTHLYGSLNAVNVFGMMRGLETLLQLVDYDFVNREYSISRLPIEIHDSPRFEWRGLLIDTARHYLPVSVIYRMIEGLSASKMNTLHWHSVDAESFPIYSQTYPRLSTFGAWAPNAIYTHDDVKSVIEYGLQRGVRVVVEFDVPGHAASWGKGEPLLTVQCPRYSANINNIPLDPSNPFTYEVLSGFLSEMSSLFTDDFMHLGGDEIVTGCWLNNTKILAWMSSQGFRTALDVEKYFESNLVKIVQNIGKKMVVWQDILDDGVSLPLETIIQIWKTDTSSLKNAVSRGYRAITSAGWYLAMQIPNPKSTHYEYQDTWIDFYNNDPFNGAVFTNQEKALIKGGEAAMWGEQADGLTIDGQVWPRTAAIGERLWSAQTVTDITDARIRLIEHSCRLQRRGISSTPLAPGYCLLPW